MEQATSLILIAAAAFCLPLLTTRLRTPAVVLELLFGIFIGPMTGWIEGSELLDLLARLGLFLLMFLAGFEIDFRALERQGRDRLLMLVGVFALTLVAAHWFTVQLGYSAFMTLVLATTSVGLVVPTLRNTRRSATRLGQFVLISAIMADFLTLVLVAILALVERHGVSLQLLQMPALFIAVIMVLRSLRLAVWWFPERFRPSVLDRRPGRARDEGEPSTHARFRRAVDRARHRAHPRRRSLPEPSSPLSFEVAAFSSTNSTVSRTGF